MTGLTAHQLTLARGERVLVRALDLEVVPGELLLLRGPNGAGKTTLLLALAGLVRPLDGTVSAPALHLVGHLSAVKGRLSVLENLRFWTAMNAGDPTHIAPALEAVGLGHAAELEAGHLSAGQTRRLALARLLTAERPLWLLDEPTAALDSDGELLIRTLLDAHLKRGGLAVAATHHDIHIPPPANVRTLTLGAPA